MGLRMGKYKNEEIQEDWRKDMERAVDDANARIAKAEKELEAAKKKKADIRSKYKDKTAKQDQKDKIQLARSYAKPGSRFHSKYRGAGG